MHESQVGNERNGSGCTQLMHVAQAGGQQVYVQHTQWSHEGKGI